jgi:predicted acylesterase/phospholipase RssA
MARFWMLIMLVVGLGACATDRPLALRCERFDQFRILLPETPGPTPRAAIASQRPSPFAASIAETFVRPGVGPASRPTTDTPSRFLILSGGGQWGAFGAGFLKGWSGQPALDPARPDRFDMVTGVSTGSLQATFAFLGKGYDQQLIDAYSITDERQLLKRHGSLFFIRHASMADTAPLETYVRDRLRPLIDQVAAPENDTRKLYVGVVDGLDGRMYAVDLTRMTRELAGREREDCYIGALLASSAVPLVFRQVRISDKPYLDGGVRQSVFVTEFQKGAHEALSSAGRKGDIYVLMNGDVTPSKVATLPPKLLPTLNRLRSITFNQVELASIYGVASSFPDMRTYVATAAGNECNAPSDEEEEIFSPAMMRCLRAYGEARWTTGASPWQLYSAPSKP